MAPTPKKAATPKKTPAAKKSASEKKQVLRRSARKTPQRSCSKTKIKSTEEQVVESMKKFAFKASPLNRKILAPGCMTGIPLVPRTKKATVVQPFSFATDDRLAVRKKVADNKIQAAIKSKTSGARIAKPVTRPPLRTANSSKKTANV